MPKPTSVCRATERKHLWPMVRLGDVCEVVLGGTPKTGITEYWDGDIPWLTPGDMGKITQMYVDASNCKRKISQLGLDNGSTLCPARSVILSTRAPIGYAFVNSVPMATNQGCKTLVPSDDVYPEYLCFNLLGRTDELNELGTGTTFKELATGRLKAMPLPLPPLSIQREIVARLERELAAVEKIKKGFEALAETAKAEFKAELKEVFEEISRGGAETRRLGDVCKVQRGGSPRPIKDYITDSTEGLNWIKIGDVEPAGKYITQTVEKIKASGLNKTRKVSAGDFLLSNSMSFGRPYILKIDGCIHDGWLVLKGFSKTFTEDFFYYLLRSPIVQEQFDKLAHGSTVRNLNTDVVSRVSLPLPPLAVQREVVARLDAAKARAGKLELKAREGVAACETMRKAILKEAFE